MPSDQEIKKSESNTDSYPGERRRGTRFPFLADFEGLEPKSKIRIEGRVSDIGLGGCYVETINPLPDGTLLHIRIRKDKACFTARAKVASSQMHMGMGLVFVSAEPEDVALFQKWLRELNGVVPQPPAREPPASAAPKGDATKPRVDPREALSELFVLLTRKGILTEKEGDDLLRKLSP